MVSLFSRRSLWASWLLLIAIATKSSANSTTRQSVAQNKGYPRPSIRRLRNKKPPQQNQRREQFLPMDPSWSEDGRTARNAGGDTNPTKLTPEERDAMEGLDTRIIGGQKANEGAYPFFVQWSRGCGGSLIHEDLVLSAAHCYSPNSNALTVWVGGIRTEQARERTIVEVRVHPLYDRTREAHDFVILRLDEAIRGAIQPVKLNTRPDNFRTLANGETLTVLGYGVTDVVDGMTSPNLLETNVNYISDCAAQSAYEPGVIQDDIMFCAGAPAGRADSCQGDSGGPILDSENRQIGVVSFGRGCGESEYPGVYARVSAVSEWIENVKCMSVANRPSDCVEITINIDYDGYPSENSWTLFDVNENVIYQVNSGDVTTSGRVATTLSVRTGSYKFVLNDKLGDGMCCLYGNGFISIDTGSGTVETGGEFEFSTSLSFNVKPQWPGNAVPQQQGVYSHTVALRVTINYDSFPQETSWKLVNDDNGRIIAEATEGSLVVSGEMSYDYYDLTPGYYWFTIRDASTDGICCRSGGGGIKVDQIDASGNYITTMFASDGKFGAFLEEGFEVI